MTQPSRIDGLPDLPKLPDMPTFDGVVIAANGFCEGYYLCKTAEAHGLACYEAGSAAAAQAAKQVPAGWALVPRYPTDEMMEAPAEARPGFSTNVAYEIYRAMLAAAPSAPSLAEAAEAGQVEAEQNGVQK